MKQYKVLLFLLLGGTLLNGMQPQKTPFLMKEVAQVVSYADVPTMQQFLAKYTNENVYPEIAILLLTANTQLSIKQKAEFIREMSARGEQQRLSTMKPANEQEWQLRLLANLAVELMQPASQEMINFNIASYKVTPGQLLGLLAFSEFGTDQDVAKAVVNLADLLIRRGADVNTSVGNVPLITFVMRRFINELFAGYVNKQKRAHAAVWVPAYYNLMISLIRKDAQVYNADPSKNAAKILYEYLEVNEPVIGKDPLLGRWAEDLLPLLQKKADQDEKNLKSQGGWRIWPFS